MPLTKLKTEKSNFFFFKQSFFIFCVLGIILATLYFRNSRCTDFAKKPMSFFRAEYLDNSLECYDQHEHHLQSSEDAWFSPPTKSIFFVEASCKGGIDSRQACAIESAARANPNWNIYVMMAGTLRRMAFHRNPILFLRRIENVHFIRVQPKDFSEGTPFESFFSESKLSTSPRRVDHASLVMRYLTMYKYGGLYLDLDVVVVKSFDSLPRSFLVRRPEGLLTPAVFALNDNRGKSLAEFLVNGLAQSCIPEVWECRGIDKVDRICPVNSTEGDSCKGIPILDSKYFFPVKFSDKMKYFEDGQVNLTQEYVHYIWNDYNYERACPPDALYADLARTFCPNVYEMYGKRFASNIARSDKSNFNFTLVNVTVEV